MRSATISPWLWILTVALVISFGVILLTIQPTKESSFGFVLPPGDAELGKRAFVELDCVKCHTVAGVDFGVPAVDRELLVPLGGEVIRVKTYGHLATAIIHPSESIRDRAQQNTNTDGESLMPEFRTSMTVEQLVNLVHFLSEHYEIASPRDDSPYSYYPHLGVTDSPR